MWRSLSPVLSDSVIMSAGTILGSGATILIAPLLSRLYEPTAFGMLAVYVSLLALAAPVSSLRYEAALPIEKDDATAANLLVVCIALAFLTSGIAGGISIWYPQLISRWAKDPGLNRYLVLLPVAFWFSAVYQILSSWAIKSRAFQQIARTRISQSVGSAGIQLATGAMSGSVWGLFAGDLVGRAAGTGVLARHLIKTWPVGSISFKAARLVMRRYIKFPLLTTWASVLTMAGAQLPVLILSRSFGLEAAGWYALTSRVLGTPSSLVGMALGQAFLGHAAHLSSRKNELRALTESTAGWVFAVGLPVFLFIGLEGRGLFVVAFGPRWADAGLYAQLLAPLFCLWMVASPLNHLLTIREWQGTTVGLSILHCAFTVGALYYGILVKSATAGIAALGVALFLLTAANLQRLFAAGYTGWGRILRRVAPMAACAALAIGPVALLIRSPALWGVTVRFLAAGGIYLSLLRVWKLYPSDLWNAPEQALAMDYNRFHESKSGPDTGC